MKKITNDNYPVLQIMYEVATATDSEYMPRIGFMRSANTSSGTVPIANVLNGFYKNCKTLFLEARSNVDYLVKHLFDRIDTDKTFRNKCFEVAFDVPDCGGVILLPFLGGSILYSIYHNTELNVKIISACQMKDKVVIINEVGSIESNNVVSISPDYSFSSFEEGRLYDLGQVLTFVITYLIFKHFAEIEFVEVKREEGKGKKATAKIGGEEYQTQTYYPVTVIDSTWFKTIKTDAFGVSGHWRRQWYATTQKHRLIWIEGFEKSGYTKKAKISHD